MDVVTLVWIAAQPPDAAQARSLSEWANTHSVALSAPTEDPPRGEPSKGSAPIADEVETSLERARDALAARDAGAADDLLATAEAALRGHAELPQAAWLMAEVERCRAVRWDRLAPRDEAARDRALARASALDGGRAVGVLESPVSPSVLARRATLRLHCDPPPRAELWLDGRRLGLDASAAGLAIETVPGLHAIVVARDGIALWSRWVEVPEGGVALTPELPLPAGCSTEDVAQARIVDGHVDARNVLCPRWAAAEPGTGPGDVRLALCESNHCGPLVGWYPSHSWVSSRASEQRETPRTWPAWVTPWSIAGAGALVLVGTAVVLGEALRSSQPQTRFVYGGLTSR
jgi:hypothetical protein